jgi:hypothetical protein
MDRLALLLADDDPALRALVATQPQALSRQKLDLECSTCGYGAVSRTPPERCPMCQAEGTWIHVRWRPFSRHRALPKRVVGVAER